MFDLSTRLSEGAGVSELLAALGFSGIAIFGPPSSKPPVIPDADVIRGIELVPKSAHEVRKLVLANRRNAELIAVRCGDTEITRAATELPEVDFVVAPWTNREDGGLNHVLCRLARENNVAIVFDFAPILRAGRRQRAKLLGQYEDAAAAVAKAKSPFVLASGAEDRMELRGWSDLAAFGRELGLPDGGMKEAFSDARVRENRKKLGPKWVAQGIELE